MAVSYKPLWKMLIDADMTKKELREKAGISKSTMDKMARGENVSMAMLERICDVLYCDLSDLVEYKGGNKR